MNSVVLTGYIATDVELKSTPQGVPFTSFFLAVKRPKTKTDTTDFITIVCWRNTAEFVSKYFKKGSGIEVKGMVTVRKWQDMAGNNRYATEITAEEVDFGKKSKNDEAQSDVASKSSNTVFDDYEEIQISDDLPF